MDLKPSKKFEYEQVVQFNDGDCIFPEGDTGRDLFVVQAGVVKITKKTDKGDIEIAEFKKGDFFGDMSLLQSIPRYAGAYAKGPVKLLVLKPAGFLLKIRRDPTFAFEMLQQLSFRVMVSSERLLALVKQFNLPEHEVKKIIETIGNNK